MFKRYFEIGSIVILAAISSMSPGSAARAGTASSSLEFSQASYSIAQTAQSVTLTVYRSGGSSGFASVHYGTEDGTALYNVDYKRTVGQLTWADGDSAPKAITVAIDDSGLSQSRTFSIKLFRARDASIGIARTASVTIAPATVAGNLVLASPSYSIPVSGNALTVPIQRTGGSSGVVAVNYSTIDGTAIAGANYTATAGTMVWANGDVSSKSFAVPITDASFIGNKTFTVALSNPTGGAAVSNPSAASVMIVGAASVPPTPTPTPAPPVTGTITSPVFLNGKFYWAGDWNSVPFNYALAAAGANGSGPVIGMPGSEAYEYWLPYPTNNSAGPASNGVNFNLSGLKYFTIAIKPSQAGALANMQFFQANGGTDDIPYGNMLDISQAKYGPGTMVAGQWNVYTIPLADFGVSGWIYKFIIQQQGVTPQSWEIDQVGFE
jgi:Calx-beta domain